MNGQKKSILVIDDDTDLCSLMTEFLSQYEFRVTAANDGRAGLARALEGGFDLIILDVMMPVLNGFEVLGQVRQRSSTPVIMLTARTAQSDRVTGLDAGADDYLPKPFDPEELLARIRAVLRRSGYTVAAPSATVSVGEIRLNTKTREVWRADEPLGLTSIEFDILNVLARSAGRVVSRDELAAALYQRQSTPYERSIDVHISHLRKKLERDGRVLIRTVRGVGYLFSPTADGVE